MRLLVIEDDPEVREFLIASLEAELFAVDTAENGEQGSYHARTNDYDLIILDNLLPKKNGLAVCQEIRDSGKATPIIMLSALTAVPDKVNLLNTGADDYLTKPYSFNELKARINALLRRPHTITPTIFTVDDLTINCTTQEAIRHHKPVYLTRKEFSLLELLMKHQGQVVSRGMIMEHVWNMNGDLFSNTIETHVSNLRRKLNQGRQRDLVKSITGRGYKIE